MLTALLLLKVNVVNPLEAMAVSVNGAVPRLLGLGGANVSIWLLAPIASGYASAPVTALAPVAVTVKLNTPPAFAVPRTKPALDSVSPAGRLPEVKVKVQI